MEKESVLPKNVRQIGDIQGNRRIYMEDYVMTYIHRKEQQEEQGFLGVFLGERQETEDGTLLFIRGLVEVPGEDKTKQKEQRAVKMDTGRSEGKTEGERKEKTAGEKSERIHFAGSEKAGKQKEEHTDRPDVDQSGEELKEAASGDSVDETAEGFLDTEEFSDSGKKSEMPEKKRTVLEECREFFGPCEIQGCCVVGEYPVKRMECLAEEVPQSRQFLYHLQEQEETLYWAETDKYEQISGYFVFYEQNKEMQEYMAEMFEEEESEQNRVPDKAIKDFRAKIRKKDQIRLNGMLKLASSFFVVAVLLVGAVVVNRIEAGRSRDAMLEVPENEAQGQLPSNSTVVIRSGGTDSTGSTVLSGETGIVGGGTGADAGQLSGDASGETGSTAAADLSGGIDQVSGDMSDEAGGAAAANLSGGMNPAADGSISDEAGSVAVANLSGGMDQTVSDGMPDGEGAEVANLNGGTDPTVSSGMPDEVGSAAGTDPSGGTDPAVNSNGVSDEVGNAVAANLGGGTDPVSGDMSDEAGSAAAANLGGGTNPAADGGMSDETGSATASVNSGAGQPLGDASGMAGTTEAGVMSGTDAAQSDTAAGSGQNISDTEMTAAAALIQSGIGAASGSPVQNVTNGNEGQYAQNQNGSDGNGNGDLTQPGTGTETGDSEITQTSGNGTVPTDGAGSIQTGGAGAEAGAGTTVEASARGTRASYVIREGDTLADICQTYYGGLDKLDLICAANEIEDANMIIPGQKIVLP